MITLHVYSQHIACYIIHYRELVVTLFCVVDNGECVSSSKVLPERRIGVDDN